MIDSILTFCDEVLSNPVWFYIITLLIKIVICFAITILFIPVCVYIERRVAAWIQDRVGPTSGCPMTAKSPTCAVFSAWTATSPSSVSCSPWWTAANCS